MSVAHFEQQKREMTPLTDTLLYVLVTLPGLIK